MITASMAVEDKSLLEEVHTCFLGEPVQVDYEQSHVGDLGGFYQKLQRSRPDIVLIDVSALREPVSAVLTSIRAAAPHAFLIALNTGPASAVTVLDCFRAGADEYLFPPISEGLKKALERKLREKALDGSVSDGKTIACLSAKGGCGATTIACHVAAELSRMKSRTLLADFDLDSGTVGFLMKCVSTYSIADAFSNTHRLDPSFWSALVTRRHSGPDVIGAPSLLTDRQEPDQGQVRRVLAFARTRYNWAIADLGRGLTRIAMTALESADLICLISSLEVPALHQSKIVVQAALDRGVPADRIRLILNRVPRRWDLAPAELQKMIGFPIFAALPDNGPELESAYTRGELLAPTSEAGRQFANLARRLAGAEEPKRASLLSLFRKGVAA